MEGVFVMAVLITGGTGFIGSHTCVELLESGHEIVVMDNFSNSCPEVLERIKKITGKDFAFYEADLLNEAALDKIFAENKIDSVVHFAGLKAVGESVEKPLEYYENNVSGSINLFKAMRKAGTKKLVFSSSATVYGIPKTVPITEDFPLSAINPYGATKLMIEDMLRDIAHADDTWRISLLRYFNPIGAHECGLIGEDPNGIPNNLLPYVAQVASGRLPYLNVYGDDYDTPDGTGVRDYIHVVDLAKGHLNALNKLQTTTGCHAYNLGTGVGYSVLDIVKAFEKACGKEIPYKMAPRRAGDAATCYSDPSFAKEELGWTAKLNLDDMCQSMWHFTELNPKGIRK